MNSASTHFIILRKGREKSLKHRHRWIFSGAVQNVPTNIPNGATVEVRSATGEKIGFYLDQRDSRRQLTIFCAKKES